MPASEALLCLFIATEGASHVTEGTVASWLSGLEMWHSINGASWTGGRILTQTKKGIAKLTPPNCHHPPRDPISFNHMITLRSGLDLSNTHDAAIWAVACVVLHAPENCLSTHPLLSHLNIMLLAIVLLLMALHQMVPTSYNSKFPG